jgi:hypothetical protein
VQRVRQGRRPDKFDSSVDPGCEVSRTCEATLPSSIRTWSTPRSVRVAVLFVLRVVESPVMSRWLARTAAAIPTEDVPPRMRIDCPDCASRPTVSEPWAVCSISGMAPRIDHSRSLANRITWLAGTQVYSA